MTRPATGGAPAAGPFARIVLPLDGSALAERALPCAEAIAPAGAEVTLLRVIDSTAPLGEHPNPGFPLDPGIAADLRGRMDEVHAEAARYLGQVAARIGRGDLRVRTRVVDGDPATRIVEATREGSVAVVMSTHGRTGLDRVLIGSVAERVVREAAGPVLVVR